MSQFQRKYVASGNGEGQLDADGNVMEASDLSNFLQGQKPRVLYFWCFLSKYEILDNALNTLKEKVCATGADSLVIAPPARGTKKRKVHDIDDSINLQIRETLSMYTIQSKRKYLLELHRDKDNLILKLDQPNVSEKLRKRTEERITYVDKEIEKTTKEIEVREARVKEYQI